MTWRSRSMSEYGVGIVVFAGFVAAVVLAVAFGLKLAWLVFRGTVRGAATLTAAALRGWKPPR